MQQNVPKSYLIMAIYYLKIDTIVLFVLSAHCDVQIEQCTRCNFILINFCSDLEFDLILSSNVDYYTQNHCPLKIRKFCQFFFFKVVVLFGSNWNKRRKSLSDNQHRLGSIYQTFEWHPLIQSHRQRNFSNDLKFLMKWTEYTDKISQLDDDNSGWW